MQRPETDTNNSEPTPTNGLSTWDEVRRLAEELELRVHLAGMDTRDRWRNLVPRLAKLEHQITHARKRVSRAIAAEIAVVKTMLYQLRDEMTHAR